MGSPSLPAKGPQQGFADPNSSAGKFNALAFLIQQLIGKIGTMMPVQVVGTSASGLVAPPRTVNIVPQVNQIDGGGNPTPHGTIFNIPVWRYQAGTSAIILDPIVNDLGMAFVAMRDISIFKSTGKRSNPGSFRRYDLADSIFIGSILGVTPTSYIRFDASGNISINTPGDVTVMAGGNASITAAEASILSDNVNLGAMGGEPVARVGDTVVGGVITSGSAKVKAA